MGEPALGLGVALLGIDLRAHAGDAPDQGRVGLGGDEADGHLVHLLHPVEQRPGAAVDRGDLGRRHLALGAVGGGEVGLAGLDGGDLLGQQAEALGREGEDHVVGVQRVAVVEGHALAQLQLDGQVVDLGPLGRQHRLAGQVALLPLVVDQALVDRVEHARADVRALAHHVQRAGGDDVLHGDGDHGAVVALGHGGQGRGEAQRGERAGGRKAEMGGHEVLGSGVTSGLEAGRHGRGRSSAPERERRADEERLRPSLRRTMEAGPIPR